MQILKMSRSGLSGPSASLTAGMAFGIPPIIKFGSSELQERFLPELLTCKKRSCIAITEPDAGSDVANITTTAERRGDVFVVNGAKKWITNGIFADYCTAAVRTGSAGRNGISALIIPLKARGVTCSKIENSGVNASGSTFIEFDDVEVPVANLLGPENKGFDIVMFNFNHERLWLACTSLRMARVCAEDAYAHALRRETFGKKLIENQTILTKIAEFGRQIEPIQAYMESLVYMIEHERRQRQGSSHIAMSITLDCRHGRSTAQTCSSPALAGACSAGCAFHPQQLVSSSAMPTQY